MRSGQPVRVAGQQYRDVLRDRLQQPGELVEWPSVHVVHHERVRAVRDVAQDDGHPPLSGQALQLDGDALLCRGQALQGQQPAGVHHPAGGQRVVHGALVERGQHHVGADGGVPVQRGPLEQPHQVVGAQRPVPASSG